MARARSLHMGKGDTVRIAAAAVSAPMHAAGNPRSFTSVTT